MSSQRLTERLEVLTELMGFTPLAVLDEIVNSVNDLIYESTRFLEDTITADIEPGLEVEQVRLDMNVLYFRILPFIPASRIMVS